MSASYSRTVDDLGIANDTIVVYTTDNGPNQFSWPDAATTPFRNEKNSNWEGAYRVPALVRWPGHIQPETTTSQVFSGLDWFPTLLAAAGNITIKDQLLTGWQPEAGGQAFKVHLDGYNQLPFLTGAQPKSARSEFFYFNDDGHLVNMRYEDWKLVFEEQGAPGGWAVWRDPFTKLRVPKMFNLRMDPYERADIVTDQYNDWLIRNNYVITRGMVKAAAFLETFVQYPPSQRPASFTIDQIRESVDKRIEENAAKSGNN
jgi:arylsulfatase A-like enzyme